MVRSRNAIMAVGGGAIIALTFAMTPAFGGARDFRTAKSRMAVAERSDLGAFTPANGDPRLAAALARSGISTSGFRFTPASTSVRLNRSVTVAVRARSTIAPQNGTRIALVSPPSQSATSLSPTAYNLGVSIGWGRFAVSSDVQKVDIGALGGREAVDLGLSYTERKFSTRIAVARDHPTVGTPRPLAGGGAGTSLDLGGSYRLSRNLDLTAGVRYRQAERDRLAPLADNRRDSQAVYIGTAFKF
jgi:hypothetical protein